MTPSRKDLKETTMRTREGTRGRDSSISDTKVSTIAKEDKGKSLGSRRGRRMKDHTRMQDFQRSRRTEELGDPLEN